MKDGDYAKSVEPGVTISEVESRTASSSTSIFGDGRSVSPVEEDANSSKPASEKQKAPPPENQANTSSNPQRRGISVLRWWLPELSAAAFSIASLLAIVVVLQAYDNKPLADLKLPKYLTLNGLIAALATFDRVFLIVPVGSALSQEAWLWFVENGRSMNPRSRLPDLTLSDQASRGAWGSFLFIFYARRRWLAMSGALLTLCSLTIGTFIQQLVSIEDLTIKNPASVLSPGNIPRSTILNDTSLPRGQIGYSTPLNTLSPAYQGIFAETAEPVPATCLTGNCTFPATPSLGVCGSCAPLPYQQAGCNETLQSPASNSSFGWAPHCNYTTDSGNVFTIVKDTAQTGYFGTIFQVTAASHPQLFASQDVYYLWKFAMMGYPYGYLPGSPGDHGLAATQCALWMCVNVWETDVSSGIQNHTIVSTISQMTSELNHNNLTWHFHANDSSESEEYIADTNTFQYLLEALQSVVFGRITSDGGGYLTSQDSVLGFWNGTTDVDRMIANLATTLTNYVRTANPTPNSRYDGTASQLGIKVQWVWITPPAVMVAMSVLLLAVVIMRTVASEVSSWKASPLTLLLFSVDGAMKKDALDLGWPDVVSGAEYGVGDRSVVLRREKDGGWMFRGV